MTLSDAAGGLYVHVPFCLKKCAYCDFYSTGSLELADRYVSAVQGEIASRADTWPVNVPVDAVYFGGGTPSLMTPEQLTFILRALRGNFAITTEAEITLEANPATADLVKLRSFHESGVNRLSIGMQSFQDDKLTLLGRSHNVAGSRRIFADARKSGFDNISIDLIYGLPGQSITDLCYDLQQAVALDAEHISAYMLTLEPRTALFHSIKIGAVQKPDEGFQREAFDIVRMFLREHGYEAYEVSNFARAAAGRDYRSRHNQKYWNFAPYLGFGPAAHSFLPPNRRSWNFSSVKRYVACQERGPSAVEETEELTSEQRRIEMVYLGLRQSRGLDIVAFDALGGKGFARLCGEPLRMFIGEGLLNVDEGYCRLTDKGAPLLDYVTRTLVGYI